MSGAELFFSTPVLRLLDGWMDGWMGGRGVWQLGLLQYAGTMLIAVCCGGSVARLPGDHDQGGGSADHSRDQVA